MQRKLWPKIASAYRTLNRQFSVRRYKEKLDNLVNLINVITEDHSKPWWFIILYNRSKNIFTLNCLIQLQDTTNPLDYSRKKICYICASGTTIINHIKNILYSLIFSEKFTFIHFIIATVKWDVRFQRKSFFNSTLCLF